MARATPTRNNYEEDPDECKERLERKDHHEGESHAARPTRSTLLKEHERHLKLLTSGAVGPRNFILPLPYSPAKGHLDSVKYTRIKDVKISSRHPDSIVVVRTITEPYVYSASITVVEDEDGDVARLTVCNMEDSFFDPVLSKDSMMAIRQPCWSITADGSYHIRVDHPSDFFLLEPSSKMVPSAWQREIVGRGKKTSTYWTKEGDSNFLNKRFREALAWYVHHHGQRPTRANP